MKRKKDENLDNILDFIKIKDQKELDRILQKFCELEELDFEEFRVAIVGTIKSLICVARDRNQDIDHGFDEIIKHLKGIYNEIRFLNKMLFVECVLNQEHRDGLMSIEKKEELAQAFGIDFKKFIEEGFKKEGRK